MRALRVFFYIEYFSKSLLYGETIQVSMNELSAVPTNYIKGNGASVIAREHNGYEETAAGIRGWFETRWSGVLRRL